METETETYRCPYSRTCLEDETTLQFTFLFTFLFMLKTKSCTLVSINRSHDPTSFLLQCPFIVGISMTIFQKVFTVCQEGKVSLCFALLVTCSASLKHVRQRQVAGPEL